MTPLQAAAATVVQKAAELKARVVDLGETRHPMLKMQKAPLVAATALELLEAHGELARLQVAALEELQAIAKGRGDFLVENREDGGGHA